MKYLILFFLIILGFSSRAQQTFTFDQSSIIKVDSKEIPIPFGIGINAAQFNEMDANGDGLEELIVWDINSRRTMVFKVLENGFEFIPEMSYYFPSDAAGFLVLADFDGDGRKDLFTSSPFGIKAYRNVTPTASPYPRWEVAQNFLRLDNGSNVQANLLDIPLIMDVDGDGDLDIVTFNFVAGDYLEFYKNTSVERKGVPDIDGFAFPESRWGKFEFCTCDSFSFGLTCAGLPINQSMESEEDNFRIEHAGGHSILYADFNEDGVFDLLLGQDECSTLYYLPNKGSNAVPLFEDYSTLLPGYGPLPEFPIFHASFLWKNDLLVSSNSSTIAGIFNADYAENIFRIPPGQGNQSSFLQSELLDLGENTRPFFKGFKNSGGLILTANSMLDNKVLGIAYRFEVSENTWELKEKDFLNLSALDFTDLQYFEYQNTLGQNTFWVTGVDTVNFSLQRRIFYSRSADLTNPVEITVPVTGTRALDHVELFAYENKDYLLLAKQTGELVLFSIDFSQNGNLTLESRDFLGYSDNPATRNLSVHVLAQSKPSLYAIDQRGVLVFIPDFMNTTNRETVQIRLLDNELGPSRFGRNTWVTSLGQPFSDQRDLLLGNTGGGLEYLKLETNIIPPSDGQFLVNVYPNPTIGNFKVLVSQNSKARLVSLLGQVLMDEMDIPANVETEVQAPYMAPGVYILQLTNEKGQNLIKKVIIKP
ncbi:T9SS type A sorting domain-containing protein [Shivajiella indica]|uniref:T9SS type A sorting domain-containing protein n=1 Tax=Shivajiella indica TaxID=872115 RepID=A0ABW5BA49_9BACT